MEIDVGRTTTLSPSDEKPEQILPKVTVRHSEASGRGNNGNDEGTTIAEEDGQMSQNNEIVSSPEKEVSLGSQEKAMREHAKEV